MSSMSARGSASRASGGERSPAGGRGRIVSIQTTRERGGAEYANVDLLNALVARGHDVVLLTNLLDLAVGTDVPIRRLRLGPKLSLRSAVWIVAFAPLILLRLARALRAEQPVSVLMLHFKKEQLLCSLLPRRLTGEVVWFEWGPVPPALRRGLPRRLYALAARRPRAILAVAESTAESVIETGVPSTKVTVMPNLVNVHALEFDPAGRDEVRRAWGVGDDTLVVGCITRFQARKRTDVAVDAIAHLGENVLLVLAGEGEEERALRERAAPYGDRVRFESNVRGRVEAFLSACDLFVFAPSPTEADRPRVIVMAQLVGVPVVSTHPEGAAALRPPGAGTIVTPHHDPAALAAAIEAYREDPERRRREASVARAALLASYDLDQTLLAVEQAIGLDRQPA